MMDWPSCVLGQFPLGCGLRYKAKGVVAEMLIKKETSLKEMHGTTQSI